MAILERPSPELALKVLPPPLHRALRHVFAQKLSGCMLVGGTALAGYYAGHRRSDDIDLFTADSASQEAAVLAVLSLEGIGAAVEPRHRSAQYFKAFCLLDGHRFTADVALHASIFRAGRAVPLPDGAAVADLDTLLMMKAAALLSRCAEKDLFDLFFILEGREGLSVESLVERAAALDAGATPENLLIAVLGAELREEACDFSLDPAWTAKAVFQRVSRFRGELAKAFDALAKKQPLPPIGKLIEKVRRVGPPGFRSKEYTSGFFPADTRFPEPIRDAPMPPDADAGSIEETAHVLNYVTPEGRYCELWWKGGDGGLPLLAYLVDEKGAHYLSRLSQPKAEGRRKYKSLEEARDIFRALAKAHYGE
ncbi:MAG TPA: hypothetical protein DCM05_12905 [Elusimicrobia bacterium]|nr:hypothetical protein [Elusimicrobiota bacterium]